MGAGHMVASYLEASSTVSQESTVTPPAWSGPNVVIDSGVRPL